MEKRIMKCKLCGGTAFRFRWEYEKKDALRLYLCHEGIGYQLTDGIITCDKCGKESNYEAEDFIEAELVKQDGEKKKNNI